MLIFADYTYNALKFVNNKNLHHSKHNFGQMFISMNYFKVLFVILFWIKISTGDNCRQKTSCSECVEAGPSCTWCADEIQQSEFSNSVSRCNTVENLKAYHCKNIVTLDKGSIRTLRNEKLKDVTSEDDILDAVQIKPQKLSIKLRPHETQKFDMTYRPAKDYPLDLYYLMDLSWSMRDDKEMLASLKDDLPMTLKKLTAHSQIAFGSFADKAALPYISIAKSLLQNPCGKESNRVCSPTYEFQHHLKLTSNFTEFSLRVKNAEVTGNLDDLEGGLSALVQVIVCKDIGWKKNSRKIVIFATNGLMHVAGEGSLGGAILKNDCSTCHLVNGRYDKTDIDYPSLACVHRALKKDKVFVIFAVTEDRVKNYMPPHKLMEQYTSLAILKNDSSNILELVEEGYIKSVSTAKFMDDASSYLKVRYLTNCGKKNQPMIETNMCNDVEVGKEYDFSVEVTLLKCPPSKNLWKTALKIEEQLTETSLFVDLQYLCGCPCEEVSSGLTSDCNFHGSLKCGQCVCDSGWVGKNCNCSMKNTNAIELRDRCVPKTEISNGSHVDDQDWAIVDFYNPGKQTAYSEDENELDDLNTPRLCSGNGACFCGECKCFEKYTGEFCQCEECPRSGTEQCGGPSRGSCNCGKCICEPGWKGKSCDCSEDESTCQLNSNSEICSGNGECVCGKCKCSADADGKACFGNFCEFCGTNKLCDEFEDCARCYAEWTSKKREKKGSMCEKECFKGYNNETETRIVDDISTFDPDKICTFQSEYSNKVCKHDYTYQPIEDKKYLLLIAYDCKERIGTAALSGYIILATLLLGLLVLLGIKLCFMHKDRKEAALLEANQQKNLMTLNSVDENPLYRSPITTVNLSDVKFQSCEGCRMSKTSIRTSISSTNMKTPPSSPMLLNIPDHID